MKKIYLALFLFIAQYNLVQAQYESSLLAGKAPLTTVVNPEHFQGIAGIIKDSQGNYIISDRGRNKIRKLLTNNTIVDIAGNGTYGYQDGTGTAAQFNQPGELAINGAGDIFVLEDHKNYIRKISAAGVVTTFAGSNSGGDVNGTGTGARFGQLTGMCSDHLGNLYVLDATYKKIKKIEPDGKVSTLLAPTASPFGSYGNKLCFGNFGIPCLFFTNGSTIYRLELSSSNIFATNFNSNGLSGSIRAIYYDNGSFYIADFGSTYRIALSSGFPTANKTTLSTNSFLYDPNYGLLAGGWEYISKCTNHGPNSEAPFFSTIDRDIYPVNTTIYNTYFSTPQGPVADSEGNVFFAEFDGGRIMKIDATGTLTTYAGSTTTGYKDGDKSIALFNRPSWLAFDNSGNLLVSDYNNKTIRKITKDGMVSSLVPPNSELINSYGLTVDSKNNVYVARYGSGGGIMKITPAGAVSMHISESFISAAGYQMYMAIDVKADKDDNLIITAQGSGCILSVSADKTTVKRIGQAGTGSSSDGTYTSAWFRSVQAITIDEDGSIYAIDNHIVRKIANNTVTTIAGNVNNNVSGYKDGTGAQINFNMPWGITAGKGGKLYVTDSGNNLVRLLQNTTVTDIEDQITKSTGQLQLYPNPAQGTVNIISTADGDAYIYSSLGQLVKTVSVKENQLNTINLQGLATGIYKVVIAGVGASSLLID